MNSLISFRRSEHNLMYDLVNLSVGSKVSSSPLHELLKFKDLLREASEKLREKYD